MKYETVCLVAKVFQIWNVTVKLNLDDGAILDDVVGGESDARWCY
jgi:hypothetical protein